MNLPDDTRLGGGVCLEQKHLVSVQYVMAPPLHLRAITSTLDSTDADEHILQPFFLLLVPVVVVG